MVEVGQWAEIRRLHFVRGLSMREISRRTGLARDTIGRAIHSDEPPAYRRTAVGSKLDPFKDEIHRLLKSDPKLPGQRIRELIAPLGFEGGKTIVDDYLREVRPLFVAPPRTFQSTVYRPGEICQFDVWEPEEEVSVGHGQTRRGGVVVACLGYSRAGAGSLIFTKQTPDLLAGIRSLSVVAGRAAPGATLNRTMARRTGQGKETALRLTGQAGQLVARSVSESRRLIAGLRQRARGRGAQAKLAAAQRLEELTERGDKVADQIAKRVSGEKITDRLVSLSDADARPISRASWVSPRSSARSSSSVRSPRTPAAARAD